MPDLLAGKDGMIVNPAYFTKVSSLATQPEGAGPFTLTSYVPDSHANLVRNPDYWHASQIHVANFSVLSITQPEQILSALESGQVNVAYIVGNQVAAAKAAGFKIDVIPSEVVDELDIQTTTAPFNNPKVVEAINYAINRQAIVQVQASGLRVGRLPAVPRGLRRLQLQACQRVPVQPGPGQATARAGRLRQGPEHHAHLDKRHTTRSPSRSRVSCNRSASRSPSRTSRPTPRPSSSTSTSRSRSRSTARPAACRRSRCSTSSTASRA